VHAPDAGKQPLCLHTSDRQHTEHLEQFSYIRVEGGVCMGSQKLSYGDLGDDG